MYKKRHHHHRIAPMLLVVTLLCAPLLTIGRVSAGSGTVYLSPGTGSVTKGANFSVELRTNGASYTNVQAEIAYPPANVQLISLTNNATFTNDLSQPYHNSASGILQLWKGVSGGASRSGDNGVTTLNFKATNPGNITIHLNSARYVDAQANYLTTSDAAFTINTPTTPPPTSTPAPTPNPAPTPTPSPSTEPSSSNKPKPSTSKPSSSPSTTPGSATATTTTPPSQEDETTEDDIATDNTETDDNYLTTNSEYDNDTSTGTTHNDEEKEKSGTSNTALITSGVLAAVVFIIGVGLLIFKRLRNNSTSTQAAEDADIYDNWMPNIAPTTLDAAPQVPMAQYVPVTPVAHQPTVTQQKVSEPKDAFDIETERINQLLNKK